MPLEAEIPHLLTIGFIVIVCIFAISIITLWMKNKNNGVAYTFILLHLVSLSCGFYFLMNAISPDLDYNHPMASEENSMQIGIAGVFWFVSMMSLFISIFQFTRVKRSLGKHTA
ncbi:hypothetical protein [Lysinibacillus sp. LZ02]|uniref:hypothetical protein n=1 Tax=Lysinibacillus sp. LZ02 TaxID=3420668 RepID=UPI003D35C618